MTIFPIHILELITFCLILLSVFRIFKALSNEISNDSMPLSFSEYMPNPQPLKPTPQTPETHTPNPTITRLDPLHAPCTRNSHKKTRELKTTMEPTEQHKTALKNYIGDFF